MAARVVIVGGGYGGVSVARRLDPVADVVLVEPKDAFVHAVGALRAVVDPQWQDRVFLPYDRLLARGRVVHDWARRVSPTRVRLSPHEYLDTDVLVLATGTAYPFPAKYLEDDTAVASARLTRLRESLDRTDRVLVVGGGPVGLELAGELTSAFPGLGVTVVDKADDILTAWDYDAELRESIRTQLTDRGVRIVTGASLSFLPPSDVGTYAPFTVTTTDGAAIEAQMWFRCYGARPQTDFLDEELAAARKPDGHLRVTDQLTVVGQDRVFAVGDVTDVPEGKYAAAAIAHAEVVADNILDVLDGRRPGRRYAPAPERLVLPLGPDGGASQVARGGRRVVLGPEETARLKGADLFATAAAAMLGRDLPDDGTDATGSAD